MQAERKICLNINETNEIQSITLSGIAAGKEEIATQLMKAVKALSGYAADLMSGNAPHPAIRFGTTWNC